MTISNRTLQGQPMLPYADRKIWAGNDVFATLTFLNRFSQAATPATLVLEIDDLSNAQVMLGPTDFNPTGGTVPPIWYPTFAPTMDIQIPGSIMQMTYPYQGSQICQFAWAWTGIDPVTGQTYSGTKVDVIELCAIATVTGAIGNGG